MKINSTLGTFSSLVGGSPNPNAPDCYLYLLCCSIHRLDERNDIAELERPRLPYPT